MGLVELAPPPAGSDSSELASLVVLQEESPIVSHACEFPSENATTAEVADILRESRTIAVVGLSDKPERPSHGVAAYLQRQGYRIIPVNPKLTGALGKPAYHSLSAVPEPVDIVDIFRASEAVPGIVEEAIAAGAKVVWMQEGIVHNAAAERARAAGLRVVMNKCLSKEHRALASRDQASGG